MTQKVRIVLPTYNERENLGILIPRVFEVFDENNIHGDILVVDDNSPDGTADLVESISNYYPIRLLKRDKKMGLGSAYIDGFEKSIEDGVDIIFEMDSDLSHDPKYIPEFVKKINDGFDVVIGVREKVVGWSLYRKLISWGGNFIGRNLAGIKIDDLTTGYRAYRKKVLESIDLKKIKSRGYAFQLEMLARAYSEGFNIGYVPIIFYDRKKGKSKLSRWSMLEFFTVAFKIRMGLLND